LNRKLVLNYANQYYAIMYSITSQNGQKTETASKDDKK